MVPLSALGLCGWLAVANLERVNSRFFEASMGTLASRDRVWQHTTGLAMRRPILGYGYGKKTFEKVYYGNRPPRSPFHYPHCHSYWLKIFFEQGVVGLAVGFILGGAVSKVVASVVGDIVTPVLGIGLGAMGNLKDAYLQIGPAKILWGNFINTLIDFIVIALVVYFGVKGLGLDKLDKK